MKINHYKNNMDAAIRAAGRGDEFWNERFIAALHIRGLMLSGGEPSFFKDDRYPDGTPYTSPIPWNDEHAWGRDSLIVFIPIIKL